jgi:hypothetical protein
MVVAQDAATTFESVLLQLASPLVLTEGPEIHSEVVGGTQGVRVVVA